MSENCSYSVHITDALTDAKRPFATVAKVMRQ